MVDIQHHIAASRTALTGAVARPVTVQLVLAVLCIAATVPAVALFLVGFEPEAITLAMTGYFAGSALALMLLQRGYPHGGLGICNLVTLTRLAFASALLAPLLAPSASWAVLSVAIAAFALDGVDGWLARREGRVSAFGARLDVEVDAAQSVILALNAWASGTVGLGVLILAMPRYAFMAASLVFPWMARPLPERYDRKSVCVLQIAVLIALQAPIVEGRLAVALVAGTALALGWSFGRDVLWLWRKRS